jgi:hypothetical protein
VNMTEDSKPAEETKEVPVTAEEDDWFSNLKPCDLSGEGTCESCQ